MFYQVLFLFMLSSTNLVRPGFAVVQFDNSFRNHLTKNVLLAGDLPQLKDLFLKYNIFSMDRLIKDPNMPEDAKKLGLDLIYLVKFDLSKDVFKLVKDFRKLGFVKYADPDYAKHYYFYPNDPYLHLQWSLSKADAINAWNITRGDSEVIIGIDDTGVDWRHEDLVGNIYQNLGEDADGDGHVIEFVNGHWVFDPGDVNGIDDDGNGKIDDFVGWDFYEGNNDPTPAHNGPDYAHGTHVAGIASAATNNGIGIAGVGFNCKILPLRSHWLSNSVEAVYYATNLGVDVFNMSWGGWIGTLGTAFEYAHNHGMVLVAAAGNDNTSSPSYPAAHPLVIAVAATDHYDNKSSYSNYGSWVDIAAPGDAILSTIPGNSYDSFYGTSMASPYVSGVVGLLRSIHPSCPVDSIKSILIETADPMPNDPYFNSGNLGAGRVNVYKAVSRLGREYLSYVALLGINFVDDGDGDNRPDPGETVRLYLTVLDSAGWQPAEGLRILARSLVSQLQMVDSLSFIGSLNPGDSASNTGDPVIFYVSDTSSPIKGKIELRFITDSPGPVIKADTISFQVSQPYILLVDDDEGYDFENYYIESLDSLGITYDYWDVSRYGAPAYSGILGLSQHECVIWFTGTDTLPFTNDEIDSIQRAMDSGINFIISSQNAAQSLSDNSFLNDYLHVSYVDSSVSDYFVDGVPDDPITNGLRFVVFGAGGANNATSKDAISPVNGAISCLRYHSSSTTAGIRFSGNYKLVFMAFPWEAINNSVTGYDSGYLLLVNILKWMDLPVEIRESSESDHLVAHSSLRVINNFVTNGCLLMELNAPQNLSIKIFDIVGRLVKRVHVNKYDEQLKINVSDLKSGIYYFKVNGHLYRFIVLKKL